MKTITRLLIPAATVFTLIACGSSPSPTTPSSTATRILSVSGNLSFGNVTVGTVASATFTITNSGTGPLTVSGLTVTGGLSSVILASWTSGVVPAGGSQIVTVQFTPAAAQAYSGALGVTADQTSGTSSLAISGTGIASTPAPPPTPTTLSLSGAVTDGTSHGILPNINIAITAGTNSGRSTLTDGSGSYTLTGLTGGTFTVSASATSYTTTSQSVTLTANGQLNFVLPRSGAAPPPAPTPAPTPTPTPTPSSAVQYIITGSARRCSATYVNVSGGTDQTEVNIPFTYSWPTAHKNDFLYMSCQIDTGGDTGSITISLVKNGTVIQTATANGFPNIATVSGVY